MRQDGKEGTEINQTGQGPTGMLLTGLTCRVSVSTYNTTNSTLLHE